MHRLEGPFAGDATLHSLLPELLGTVAALFGSRLAVLLLRAEAGGESYVAASLGLAPERLRAIGELAASEPDLAAAVRDGWRVVVEDTDAPTVPATHRDTARKLGYQAVVVVPLVARDGEPLGAIAAFFPRPHRPREAEWRLVERFMTQSAQMLVYARLYARSQGAERERGAAGGDRGLAEADRGAAGSGAAEPAQAAEPAAVPAAGVQGRALADAVLDQMPTGVWISEAPSGRIVYTNPELERLLGHAPRALQGWMEYAGLGGVHGDGRPYAADEYPAARVLLTGQPHRIADLRYRRGDGGWIHLAVSASPVRDAEGRMIAVVSMFQDVSERRRIEEMLRFLAEAGQLLSSSLDYQETLRHVAGLATRTLADYCIVDVVEETGDVQRIEAAHRDPARTPIARRFLKYPPRLDDERFGVPTVLRTGKALLVPEVTDQTYRALSQDEEHYRIHVELHPRSAIVVPLAVGGRVVGALTLVRTEAGAPPYSERSLRTAEALASRAALAIENARLYRVAQEAAREREELVAIVGHDLRNPLNTIAMASSLLALDSIPEEKKLAQAAIIQRAVDQAGRLIRDLLDLTRIRAGALTVRPHPLDPAVLLEDALQLLHPLAEMHSVGLRVAPPRPLPRVAADRDRILQVFSNLVGNALKFTPEGGQVMLRAEPADGEVRFAVMDTGPGIAPEDLALVFDRFWQGSHTLHQGVGLGLSIAKGIVEAHRGRIWVESELGAGTQVWFALPEA
ncbi:MAG TPA: GAF domain-containing protein [Longimicrobiales bacterium]|nr:GAF domain-containing protein [Longimicrobiales bacterium]